MTLTCSPVATSPAAKCTVSPRVPSDPSPLGPPIAPAATLLRSIDGSTLTSCIGEWTDRPSWVRVRLAADDGDDDDGASGTRGTRGFQTGGAPTGGELREGGGTPPPPLIVRVDMYAQSPWEPANTRRVDVLVASPSSSSTTPSSADADAVDASGAAYLDTTSGMGGAAGDGTAPGSMRGWRQCDTQGAMVAASTPRLPYASVTCNLPGTEVLILQRGGAARSGRLFISEIVVLIAAPAPPPRPPPLPPLPPNTPSPPPPPPPMTVAQRIDARFRLGRPSARLAEAGVLVHISDGLEDTETGRLWDAVVTVDHMSCSLINVNRPKLFSGGSTPGDGLVLSPRTPLLCAWDHDVGTQSMLNRGCGFETCDSTPGAQLDGPSGLPRRKCSWRPADMATMLERQKEHNYNEVIVSSIAWQHSLPWLVEAFVYLHGIPGATPEGEQRARTAQRAFVAAFCARGAGGAARAQEGSAEHAGQQRSGTCAGGSAPPPVLRFTGSGFEED